MGLELYKSVSEDELVEGCLQQDGKAQRALYEKFAPVMFSLCLRYVKEAQAAEDVMVTGFMRVFDKIGTFGKKGSLGGWIRRIMINEALGHLRKCKSMYLETDLKEIERQPDLNWVQDHLETEELLQIIRDLPSGYRTVFNLYAIEGYNHREIAEMLGVSENTSKSQLSRARAFIRQALLRNEKALKSNFTNHE